MSNRHAHEEKALVTFHCGGQLVTGHVETVIAVVQAAGTGDARRPGERGLAAKATTRLGCLPDRTQSIVAFAADVEPLARRKCQPSARRHLLRAVERAAVQHVRHAVRRADGSGGVSPVDAVGDVDVTGVVLQHIIDRKRALACLHERKRADGRHVVGREGVCLARRHVDHVLAVVLSHRRRAERAQARRHARTCTYLFQHSKDSFYDKEKRIIDILFCPAPFCQL